MSRHAESSHEVIDLLIASYNGEVETLTNYLAASVNPDGVRAEQIKEALAADITAELGHAQMLAKRINTLGGVVPGSQALKWTQSTLQPPARSIDLVSVIKGVIAAEEQAIEGYRRLIQACEGNDYVTQDLAITIMADEEQHRREFIGFLREYEEGMRE